MTRINHIPRRTTLPSSTLLPHQGFGDFWRQLLQPYTIPRDLETPQYTVLRRARDYQVRQYAPFIVAECLMDGPAAAAEAGAAAGDGAGGAPSSSVFQQQPEGARIPSSSSNSSSNSSSSSSSSGRGVSPAGIGMKAFGQLAGYIFGRNKTGEVSIQWGTI